MVRFRQARSKMNEQFKVVMAKSSTLGPNVTKLVSVQILYLINPLHSQNRCASLLGSPRRIYRTSVTQTHFQRGKYCRGSGYFSSYFIHLALTLALSLDRMVPSDNITCVSTTGLAILYW